MRAYYLARGLMHHGVHVTFVYPRELDPRGMFVPNETDAHLTIRTFDGQGELLRIVEKEDPRAIIVGCWEFLDFFPEDFYIPIIADLPSPGLLERLFQDEPDLERDAGRMINCYRRASRFLCATRSQRSLLIPMLILSGFDCRLDVPVDVVPVSTAPGEKGAARVPEGRWRLVSADVSWQCSKTAPYIEAIAGCLPEDGGINGELLLLTEKHASDTREDIDLGREKAEARHGTRVCRLGPLTYGEMEKLLSQGSDLGFEVGDVNVEREFSLSFRSVEYLRWGLPVICNKGLELAADIEAFEAGWSVGGPEELPGLLMGIAADKTEYVRRSENALKLVSAKHDYRETVLPVVAYLENPCSPVRQRRAFSEIIEEKRRLLGENRRMLVEAATLQEALKDRDILIERIYRSYSWRLARPLRALTSFQMIVKDSLENGFRWHEPGVIKPAVSVVAETFRKPIAALPPKGRDGEEADGIDGGGRNGAEAQKRDFSVAIVTREDIFPTHHGAAVKIERTASALSRCTQAVFVVTGDISRYYVYRDGMVEERFYPRRTRLAGLCAIGAAEKLDKLGVPRNEAFLYRAVFDRGFALRLAYIASRNKIGLFQAEFPAYATACLEARKRFSGRTLLVEHNVECDRIRSQYEGISDNTYQWLLNQEVALCNAVDHVITVSARDRDRLVYHGVDAGRVRTIPHGVDLASYRKTYEFDLHAELGIRPEIPILVYHGIYSYSPNLEAVATIASEILPRLEARGVKVKVAAIGPSPPRGDVFPDVVFTGPVDNLAPYLMQADVAVVPLLNGEGTRMKILEYFAAGVPVVSTSKGVEGIPVENGRHLIIEDSFSGMADAVVRVLRQAETAKELVRNARMFVESLDWTAIAARYIALI